MRRHTLAIGSVTLDKMLEERRNGASLLFLGRKYKKDHTTILYHCKRHGVVPLVVIPKVSRTQAQIEIEYDASYMIPEEQLDFLEQTFLPADEGPINPGKSYFSYLRAAMKDPIFKHYFGEKGPINYQKRLV
jgi:hypothetical protein